MITRHIAELLYHHECVIVPGLGGFIKHYSPASIVHSIQEFNPPSAYVAFNAGLSGNDGLMATHIASAENTTYREAMYEIKCWVDSCQSKLVAGENVTLDGIGALCLNASGRVEFTPSKQYNFNVDSFGLPVFFAKSVEIPEVVNIPEKQVVYASEKSRKLRRLIPETIKWAAVLAPFIGFILWSSINGNVIDNYVHNYTGMYSWVRSTPGKTVAVKVTELPPLSNTINPETVQAPAGVRTAVNISFDPGVVSYSELAKNNITITDPNQVAAVEVEASVQNYHIIGGAFREHDNALKLLGMLQEQGYPAAIVDTTSHGLYVVSMIGFDSYTEALSRLGEIRKNGFSTSWILKKNKG